MHQLMHIKTNMRAISCHNAHIKTTFSIQINHKQEKQHSTPFALELATGCSWRTKFHRGRQDSALLCARELYKARYRVAGRHQRAAFYGTFSFRALQRVVACWASWNSLQSALPHALAHWTSFQIPNFHIQHPKLNQKQFSSLKHNLRQGQIILTQKL